LKQQKGTQVMTKWSIVATKDAGNGGGGSGVEYNRIVY